MHDWGLGGAFMGLMPLVWLLLAGGVLWAALAATRSPSTSDDSAESVLKRRYARGEINRAEYDQRLADLRR